MVKQRKGTLCIYDKCKKVITNMEYVGIKSRFPYIENNYQKENNT